MSESYVSVRLPRAASQSLIDAFPPCAGIPGDVYNSFGSDVILTVDDGQNTAKWGCLDVTSRRGIKSTCQSYVATVFNETVTEYGDVSTKLFDAQGPLAVAGIPINVQLTGTGTVTFRHSIGWYTAGATGGGRMFQVSVEPLVRLSLSVNVAFPREYDEDVFALAATANGEVIDTSSKTLAASSQLAVVASLNVDTELTCGHIQIVNTGSSSRIDATVTSLTKNRRSTPIYESFASPWLASVAESDCCNLPPASCFQPSVADFQRGVCKCVDGWSGTGCDIVCPPDCNLPTDERLRKSCSAGKCECLPGSYGYECLLTCPGGGTCSGHGTCAPDGRCLCADGYFGRDCAATCVNGCGAEGRCVWSGSAAVCECTLAAAGPRCQAVCAKGGALQMPCSGRGRCFDSGTLVGVCVCEIGYGGAACDVRVVGGSGLALHFDGKVDSVAEFPLDLKTETTLMPRGVMATFWMFVDALPAAGVHATLVEFKYAWIQLSSSGTVKMCDATGGSDTVDQCARAPMTIAPRQWYHVAAGVRDEFGSFQVGVHVFKSGGAPRSESSAITDPREFNTLRGDTLRIGSLFTGSIDQVHVLALAPNFCSRTVVTDSETCRVMFSSRYSDQLYDLLSSIRLSILHPSHPLVVFSSQLDTGRGATQYADAPLAPGTIKGGVTRVSADGVPVVSASVASVVSAPFKLTLQSASEGGQPIEQSIFYSLELLGRRYKAIGVKLVFMATTLSQNGPYDECTITATLMPPVNSTDSPIVVLNNFKVAGGRLIYETSILSDYFGSNDRNEIVWKLNRACDGGSRFVTIDSSMMLLPTAVSDGVAQFGLHGQVVGLMESGQITGEPITAPLEASAWIWRDASVTQARDGVRGSIVQVYSGANELVLSLAEDWSAVDSSAGLRVVLANGVVLGKDDAPYSTRSGVWEHVALRVGTLGGNQCRLIALVNGRPVAQSSPFNCGNGLVKGTDAGYRVRLGANFRGRINDVLLRTGAVAGGDISREIYSEYAGLLSARIAFWSFDGVPDGAAQIPASARSAAATLTASGGAVVVERLAFRGTERCPGTSTCGLTLFERGGECGEVDGLARCACSTGFAGAECLECPGGAKNPCSGHGVCIGLVDGTMCACRRGYLGDACQHACPGMGRLENPNDFVCMNDGVCRIDGAQQRAAGGAGEPVTPLARCFCGAARDRYGDFCQFQQGQKPVFSLSCDTCGDDGDANKQCVDNVCGCGEGFYLAGEGGFRCVESRLREPPQVGASVGLIVGVLLLSALLIAAMACYGKRLIDRAPLRFEAIVKRERTDQSIREEEKRRLQDINTEAQW